MADDRKGTAITEHTTEALVELGRQVDNCEKHGDAWCSCKVRQFLGMASLVVAIVPLGSSNGSQEAPK